MFQFIRQALQSSGSNIRSNKEVFLASIATFAIALSILGVFLVIFVNLKSFLSSWSRQVQLIVYLKDEVTQDQRTVLEDLIKKDANVQSIKYISKDVAWNNFQNTFSGKYGFLSDLDFNPLPASYNINFKREAKFKRLSKGLAHIRAFTQTLQNLEGIESFEYGEKWIGRFEKFMIFIQIFLLAVGGLLSLGLILIISNTIKLSIFSRQDEIELMMLIGATHRFVKYPFLLEGIVQGFAGAILALGLIKSIHVYLLVQFQGSLDSLARGLDLQFISGAAILSMILASMLIGWIGSYITVNQFLNSGIRK